MNDPLSVSSSQDGEILNLLIGLHFPFPFPAILDCTYNQGMMWKGTDFRPKTLDIDPSYETDFVGDFRKMDFIDNSSFDILVFDPPHLPVAAASENSSKMWEQRYGITDTKNSGRDGYCISELFEPFLKEAKRILKKNGIVLAKISDLVHNHSYQWQHVDFINCARSVGLTPCDLLVKIRHQGPKSSKWKNVKHLRRCHTYWIVVRNGGCEAKS